MVHASRRFTSFMVPVLFASLGLASSVARAEEKVPFEVQHQLNKGALTAGAIGLGSGVVAADSGLNAWQHQHLAKLSHKPAQRYALARSAAKRAGIAGVLSAFSFAGAGFLIAGSDPAPARRMSENQIKQLAEQSSSESSAPIAPGQSGAVQLK